MGNQTPKITTSTRRCTCPSCGMLTTLHYAGVQHWPAAVAQAVGLPQEQILWQCSNCHTTLLDSSLTPDVLPQSNS
ncbi:MAG: hypothetical protein KC496_12250 [Anaerolineae bacterium]|nr:hypothetical protein [Anaerolineae bacterium]